jgi:hypothetical protein
VEGLAITGDDNSNVRSKSVYATLANTYKRKARRGCAALFLLSGRLNDGRLLRDHSFDEHNLLDLIAIKR